MTWIKAAFPGLSLGKEIEKETKGRVISLEYTLYRELGKHFRLFLGLNHAFAKEV